MVTNTINERISLIVQAKSKGLSDFSRKIDIPLGTLNSIVTRGSDPSSIVSKKILETFPDIDPLWYVCGIGEMQSHLNITKHETQTEIVEVLKREREVLVSNIDKLEKDKERLWTMLLETTGKKQVSNEPQRVVKLVNTDFQTAA